MSVISTGQRIDLRYLVRWIVFVRLDYMRALVIFTFNELAGA